MNALIWMYRFSPNQRTTDLSWTADLRFSGVLALLRSERSNNPEFFVCIGLRIPPNRSSAVPVAEQRSALLALLPPFRPVKKHPGGKIF